MFFYNKRVYIDLYSIITLNEDKFTLEIFMFLYYNIDEENSLIAYSCTIGIQFMNFW